MSDRPPVTPVFAGGPELGAPVTGTAVPLVAAPALTAGRVLVVEDNAVNQQVVAAMLTSLGYFSDVAVNGSDARERWPRN